MQKLINKKVNLSKIELIYAPIYLIVGKILNTYAEKGISFFVMCILMVVFTALLIVFFRQHAYGQDKPLLTALSVYYKSMAYMVVIITLFNYPGRIMFQGATAFSIIIYMLLSYIYGKKNNEMLNAYLYIVFLSFA